MSGERAAPVVVAGDRTHYLHSADADVPSIEQHSITLACGTQSCLYRWHAGDRHYAKAVLNFERGPFSAYFNVTAEQLRTMAYAMLQCATDLDADTLPPPAAPEQLVDIGALEKKPWAMPASAA